MGRPRKKIDLDLVEKLAAIHCTNTEIAATIGCNSSLLSKPRFSEIIAKGRDRGKTSLRRKMWETAQSGNVTMMIWLSKQILGYADKIEQKNFDGPLDEYLQMTPEERERRKLVLERRLGVKKDKSFTQFPPTVFPSPSTIAKQE